MKSNEQGRVVSLKKVTLVESRYEQEPPMAGTMADRISLAWELTREAVALGGKLDAEQRLQRHVTRLIKA